MNYTVYKNNIINEYYKAEIKFKAMQALIKSEGIILEDTEFNEKETTKPKETVPETNIVTPTNKPEETKPVSTEPEIVYDGPMTYNLKSKEHAKFSVYINNVNSSSDYVVYPYGSPTYISYDIKGQKTTTGYKVNFDVAATNARGQGSFKICLKKDASKFIAIYINAN